MRVLGIDPGKSCGWAVYEQNGGKPKYINSGVCDGDDVKLCYEVITNTTPDYVMIEDQFIMLKDKKGKRINSTKGTKTLIRRAAIWEILAQLCGINVSYVSNRTWQSYWRIKAGDKHAMRMLASAIVRGEVKDDEADAILIARCAASTLS